MKNIFAFIAMFVSFNAWAQKINGTVTDYKTKEPLAGASLHWLNNPIGAISDSKGKFEIIKPEIADAKLVCSFTGYLSDTILALSKTNIKIELRNNVSLKEITVTETRESVTFSTIDPLNKQSLGVKELRKAACCNLSESFEANATVDVSYTDAISGSKQIKMLGLDGSYTQVMTEMMPEVRGLSSIAGYSHIPGTWVNSIDLTKGVGSVVNGYESISGQINIEFLKPDKAEKIFINIYGSDAGRLEGNIHLGHKFNDKWSTLLFLHGSGNFIKNDFNHDGYLDMPLSSQLNIMNRWKYMNPGKLIQQFGFQAMIENKIGGQVNYSNKIENDSQKIYGMQSTVKHLEGYSKTGFGFADKPYKSIGFIATARAYEEDAFYGLKSYNGQEQTLSLNLIYQSILWTSDHKIKFGASYLLDNFNERYNDSAFKRTESVSGIFGEYNYEFPKKISVLAGLRIDYHNIYGAMVNPRVHFKFNLKPMTVLRVSGGRGMRVANIFTENAATLASSRTVIIKEQLNPEVAWNYGASLTHKFKFLNKNTTLVIDFYRTDFQNQVVADMDANPQQIIFYNLKGVSYSNSFQSEINYELAKKVELRLAYKWQDVKTTYHSELLEKPLIPMNRALVNVSYATKFDIWKFDFTTKWFGRSRIPNTSSNPDGLQFNAYSPQYFTLNGQITKAFRKFEIYVGVENILNFIQTNQIIDPAHPFGNYFDASMIWGPVMGRVIYTGIRFTIK